MTTLKEKIRRKISFFLLKIAGNIFGRSNEFPPVQYQRVKKWKMANKEQDLRLNYPLDRNSIVFDLGGYRGDYTHDIIQRYQSKIYVFEPMKDFYNSIVNRFAGNDNVRVFDFGLSNETRTELLSVSEDGSSIFGEGDKVRIKLVSSKQFFQENKISKIDLMKINIEGAEYDLLDHLISEKLVHIIKNIQIQFHDFVPNANIRMALIQNKLQETHTLTYQFPFVWENWKLKQ